jgi:tetratricopeptide (TPR) repeat protein
MMTKEFRKLNNLVGWIVWAIATITYCCSIEPTASFWDCGEYIACAYKLEVGHPPGAPFFLLIGRFFTLLAGADPANAAMMVNVMSALSSSFTILFLFWTITRLAIKLYGQKLTNDSKPQQWAILAASTIGSLAYTFSDSFWFSAVEGEVYAMSSFFTAVVFWAILKWDEEDTVNPVGALRWLVLICYLIGLSIGVHLLNLLVIPAIGFIIYFKKYKFTWKGFIIAGIVSVLVLGFVQNLIIPKIVKFISDYEVFFTNKMHLGYSTGTVFFFILLIVSLSAFIAYTISKKDKLYKLGFYSACVLGGFSVITAPSGSGMFFRLVTMGGILYGIQKFKTKTITLNAIFLSFATLLIGYSSFFVLVIRSSANTPMDENDPENAPNMLSYLLREQYGDWPILYGPYYNAPQRPRSEFGSGDPIYAKDKKNNNYKIVDARKNSIPKYEKEFCTPFPRMYSSQSHHETGYKYWGNVAEHHRNKLVEGRNGEPETIEVPTFAANFTYFKNYQVYYMYLRYLFWNFVGRQNDIQGTTGNNMDGNWLTGIGAIDDMMLDYDTSKPIYRDKNSFARNNFYALPLILGLLGMFFHFKRNKPDAWVVLCFFLLTGLAIVIYLNQTPYQPRERDYAYTGSFYAFAIWIGLGVLFLYDFLSRHLSAMMSVGGSAVLGLVVPALMLKDGWNDHNRSLRTLSRDSAINYLQSCAPNAILFTNGDNDTFPLWYAQEVEGIRTDVRVVNLSLLQTDWYIRQMRRAAYDSKPLPFSIPEEKLESEKMAYLIINNQNTTPMALKDALAAATSDDPSTKYDNGGDLLDILPSGKLYVDVDSAQVMKNKLIAGEDLPRFARRISWDLGGRNYITKNDLMVLDLVANNNWERPIYFAVTTGEDAYVGLRQYFQLEGLAYRFVPVMQTESEAAQGGRVNTEVMYNNVMNKFLTGGMDKPGVNLDENCIRMAGNMRMQMGILATALLNEGKKDKARNVLDRCLKMMPEENVPYDATIYTIIGSYYELKDFDKANALAKKLFDAYEGDLKIYNAQKPNRRYAYSRDSNQAKEILKRLTGLAQQFGQDALAKDFLSRLSGVMSPEELSPAATEPIVPGGY